MVDEKVSTDPPQRKATTPFPVNTSAMESSSKTIENDHPNASGNLKVTSSFTDMLRVRDQVLASLGGRLKSFGVGIDEPTNKLSVLADQTDIIVVEGLVSALGLQSRVSVQTGKPTSKSVTTYGGLGISVDGYNCTNGFAVTNGTNDGVLTAGHCRNGAAVSNGDNLGDQVSEALGGDQDRQIHPAPSGAIGYAFMGGNQWMAVVGTMGSWSTGNWACTYGITTNRNTCGYADSTTWSAYSNGYVGANTYVSDVLVTNFIRFSPDMWCQPGDSRGPIMNGGYALATMANEQWGWCLAPPIWNNMAGSGYWIKTI